MNKDKWVLFDLDDVVYNFREQWFRCSHLEGVIIPHWNEWPSYDDLSYFKMNSQEEMQAMFIRNQCLELAEPEPEARQAMEMLKEQGFKIGALTARSWHPQAFEITSESFKRNNLPVDKLVISGLYWDRKSAHIDKFGEVIGFVDDSASHVRDFTSKNIPNVYLRQRNWNINFRDEFNSVENLLEFAEKVITSQK